MKNLSLFLFRLFVVFATAHAYALAVDNNSTTYQLRDVLTSHTNWVQSITFSTDNTKIISASTDQSLHIYDLQTLALEHTLLGHQSPIGLVVVHPISPIIYSADTSGLVFAWSLDTAKELWQLPAHESKINDLVVSEKHLITASEDKSIKVWDIETRELLATLSEHTLAVQSLAISDDGKTLISGGSDTTVKIWNLDTFELIRNVQAHNSDIYALDINHKGDAFASGSSDNTVKIWDLQTGENLHSMVAHKSFVFAVKFAHSDKMLLSAGSDNTIKIWDTENRCLLDNQKAHFDWVRALDISLDDRVMISAGYDKIVRIFDLPSGYNNESENCFLVEEVPEDFRFPQRVGVPISAYAMSSTTLVGIKDSSPISVLDGEYRQGHISQDWKSRGRAYNGEIEVRHLSADKYNTPTSSTVNIGGIKKTFISTTVDGQTALANSQAGTNLNLPSFTGVNLSTVLKSAIYFDDIPQGEAHNITVSNGEYKQWANWVTSGLVYKGYVQFRHKSAPTYDTTTNTKITIRDKELEFNSTTLKDGYKSNDSFVPMGNFVSGNQAITNALFSYDQKNIVTTATDNNISIWKTSNKELLRTIRVSEPIQSILLTHDDLRIVSAHPENVSGNGGKIRIWDKETGVLIHTLPISSGNILAMSLDSSDQYLGVLGADSMVFLWDLDTNVLRATLQASDGLSALAIDKEASVIYVAGQMAKIQKYNLDQNTTAKAGQKYISSAPQTIGQTLGSTHANAPVTIALADDKSSFIAGGWDNELKVFTTGSNEPTHSIAGSNASLIQCRISTDSKIAICVSANQEAHIYDIKQGLYLKKLPSLYSVSTLDFDQDGRMLIVGAQSGRVELFAMNTLNKTDFTYQEWVDMAMLPIQDNVPRLSSVTDELHLPSPTKNATITNINVKNGLFRQTSHEASRTTSLWAEDGVLKDGIVEIKQLSSDEFDSKQLSTIQVGDTQKELLSITQSNVGRFTGKYQLKETMIIHSHQIVALAITKDGKKVVYVGLDNSINVIDVATRAVLTTINETKAISDVEVSHDGSKIITSSEDIITVWDIQTGELFTSIYDAQNNIISLKITPDDKYIVSGGSDGKIKVWDASSGELVRELIGHTSDVLSIDISQDSTKIVSSSKDETLKVWVLSNGTLLHSIQKGSIATHIAATPDVSSIFSVGHSVHARAISKLQISEDATKIASSSLDKTLKVWRLEDDRPLVDIIMELDAIHSFEFHPSEEILFVATGNKITLWALNESVETSLQTGTLPP